MENKEKERERGVEMQPLQLCRISEKKKYFYNKKKQYFQHRSFFSDFNSGPTLLIWLQARDELKQTSPSREICKQNCHRSSW